MKPSAGMGKVFYKEKVRKMEIKLPENVRKVIGVLEQNGYEGYAVGGCVRDSILGRVPNDWDITTSASPMQVKSLFPRTVDTGIQHGTVTVLMGREGYEVTTYRLDGEYEDCRHPREVMFTSSLTEDLRRRDFTINAMAYNDSHGLVDIFGGKEDMKNNVIRCVGNAEERFHEDALRILRAVRFSAQLGFAVEEKTADAIRKLAPNLNQISAERIQTELVKLLTSPHPDYLGLAWEYGITAVILPEFDRTMETPQNNPHHCWSVGIHTLETLKNTENEKCLRLAALFHDFGKPLVRTTDENGIDHFYGHAKVSCELAADILHRLKFDNDTIRRVKLYVNYHDVRPELTEKSVRRAVSRIGAENFAEILKLKAADTLAQSPARQLEKKEYLCSLTQLYRRILEKKQCLTIRDLAVNGRDLIADGMQPGRELGTVLGGLLEYVLENPECNKRETLLVCSRRIRENGTV